MRVIKTDAADSIEIADTKAAYDAQVKKILGNKEFLARIMKYTVDEFKNCDIELIKERIDGEPEISTVPITPSKEQATLLNSEDKTVSEGEITYKRC